MPTLADVTRHRQLDPEMDAIFRRAEANDSVSAPRKHHLVPASYLRRWQGSARTIRMTETTSRRSVLVSPQKALKQTDPEAWLKLQKYPQFRPLRGWEQANPCPPPILETEDTDPRRLEFVESYANMPAELKAMHLYDVDATMEDTDVLGMDIIICTTAPTDAEAKALLKHFNMPFNS